MPRWNYKKKTASRKKAFLKRTRNARRRKLWRKRRLRRPLPLTGYGQSKIVRLRYCDEITLDPALGGIASHYFLANGMYDPDHSLGGHQPLGFDQMMAGYDHFTVIGSRIKVTPVNNGAGTGTPGYFGVILDDNSTLSYASAAQCLESKQGKGGIMVSQKSINGNQRSAWRSFSAKKFFRKNAIVGAAEYKGSESADPTEKAYFGIWNAAVGTNNPDASIFMVEIEYIAVLTEPKFLAQS